MGLVHRCVCAALAVVGVSASAGGQVMVGQVDTFEDGTTQEWRAGLPHPAPPENEPTGGPGGAGDAYLRVTALGGQGQGGRLSVFNLSQWAGDYIAAGVTGITLDVSNFGPDEVHLRLLVADISAGPPSDLAVTDAVVLPAGSGWTSVSFAMDAASLTTIIGDASAALSNASELRLFHNPNPDFPGPPIGIPPVNAVIGVDNIRAVPAPSAAVLAGAVAAAVRRRRAPGRSRG